MSAVARPGAGPVSVPVVEIYVAGPLDLTCLAPVRAALDTAVRLSPDRLVVDMARCVGIDAAGVALLLDVHRQLLRAGADLTLRAPSARLRRILRIARVEQVLHVVPEEVPSPGVTTEPIRSAP
ncbi:STAS domain-containing protein [Phytohabitans sp. ZYX-F-186]|uniref:STAS domain-containing protein n=1 Tax=Phytohabitans maris TaxID=3071409 RepID=A0ABU0ZP79_9ACTN|nr:STAS domain-containing protein [Phytohabitans sp. ZYX-F-186]MDQ7908526.1 STAS domain-containing protein [Phytohabitans sp. ZYX-F-186]